MDRTSLTIHRDEERRCASSRLSDAITKWFGTNTDITERRLAEEEREVAAQRSRLLDTASALLASSLEYETTLKNVVDLVVPEIADWCIVDLLDAAGEFAASPAPTAISPGSNWSNK